MNHITHTVTAEDLRAECLKERYTRQLSKPEVFPSAENWEYIISRRMTGIGAGLYRKYLVSRLLDVKDRCDYHMAALEYFVKYITCVPRDYAIKVVYGDIDSCPEATTEVIVEAQLFDADSLVNILGDDSSDRLPWVVNCLKAYQPQYSAHSLQGMKNLLAAVRNPDPVGQIVTTRNVFGQSTRYICPNGHTNDVRDNYCRQPGCGLNIYGLTESQDEIIDEFERRINALEHLLNAEPS